MLGCKQLVAAAALTAIALYTGIQLEAA